jgi:glycosyltransferase involved in cell wall biosynthesis
MDIMMTCHLGPSGLSRVAREYFKLFSSKGISVIPSWLSVPDEKGVEASTAAAMMAAAGRQPDGPPLQFFVGLPERLRLLKGRAGLVGSVVVEGNLLTAAQATACGSMDVVAVPSRFCYHSCLGSGVPKGRLAYVPYPLDPKWNTGVAPSRPQGDRFRFLWMNTWHERKGYDVLLKAWWAEFSRADPVELVIKSYRENTRPGGIVGAIAEMAMRHGVDGDRVAPVVVMDELMDDEAIPAFMKSHDALVSPHRSEGFGLNPWYAMALGIPVVCTDQGGCRDFAKDDTAWLVAGAGACRPSPRELAEFPHLSGTTWVEPDMSDLRRQMRACLMGGSSRLQRSGNGARLVASAYSPEVVFGAFEEACRAGKFDVAAMRAPVVQACERMESEDKPFRMAEV